jgi:hypothetical protein
MAADGPEKCQAESIATFRENYGPPFERHQDFRRVVFDMEIPLIQFCKDIFGAIETFASTILRRTLSRNRIKISRSSEIRASGSVLSEICLRNRCQFDPSTVYR